MLIYHLIITEVYPKGISSLWSGQSAIRNVKVKQKVSGQFESLSGAQNYATLRSIIDTSRKRGLNEFEALRTVIEGNPGV